MSHVGELAGPSHRVHQRHLHRRPRRGLRRQPHLRRRQRRLHQVGQRPPARPGPPPRGATTADQHGPPSPRVGWGLERAHAHRYGGYQYPSIVLFSLFLGFLGVDRFCLQWTCLGTFKLLTIGGIGIWWLVDLILLTLGQLAPADGSLWDPAW